jgi:uncharacterized phage-associated protein
MNYTAVDIAKKIIAKTDASKGEIISNLKLQKLLYYVQGFYIAIYDKKLFDEPIEAWQYGPVVRMVYQHFKPFEAGALTLQQNEIIAELEPDVEALFDEILEEYGQFSAIKLMQMTQEELPWKTVFFENPQGEISTELMKQYFKTQIVAVA